MFSISKPQSAKEKPTSNDQLNHTNKCRGPIEGDFSKIGLTYVLENDRLIQKTLFFGQQKPSPKLNQILEEDVQVEDIDKIKQIAKLQYLEKKGFLKPEQAKRLQQLRPQSLEQSFSHSSKNNKKNESVMIQTPKYEQLPIEYEDQNIDPNIHYQVYSSPQNKSYSMKNPYDKNYYIPKGQKLQYFQPEMTFNPNQNYPNYY